MQRAEFSLNGYSPKTETSVIIYFDFLLHTNEDILNNVSTCFEYTMNISMALNKTEPFHSMDKNI